MGLGLDILFFNVLECLKPLHAVSLHLLLFSIVLKSDSIVTDSEG
jgi:hypothetical protein